MSSPYDVTVPSTRLAIQDRRGKATFLVTNATDKPLMTRIDLDVTSVESPAKAEWIKIDWVQHEIKPKVSEQVVVTLEAPPEADVEGEFNFRIVAVYTERPEEDKTPSPTVSAALAKRVVVKQGPKIPWWVFVIAGVVLLVIIIVVIVLLTGNGKEKKDDGLLELPCMRGRQFSEARAELEKKGFRVGRPNNTDEGPQSRGEVVSQRPNECPPRPLGNRYGRGTVVELTVHR